MIKNITKKEAELLILLANNSLYKKCLEKIEEDEKFRKVLCLLLDDRTYINYLNEIIADEQLKKQMDILSTLSFMEYVKDNGFENLMMLLNELSKKPIFASGKKIEYVKHIFEYIDFLLHSDEITTVVRGKQMRDDVIGVIKKLRLLIESEKLTELKKENGQLSKKNTDLTVEQSRLVDENTKLQRLNSELGAEKESKQNEIETLNDTIANLKGPVQELESKMYSISNGVSSFSFFQQNETSEIEVVWEPIDSNHLIYRQNYNTIEGVVKAIKKEYMEKTGKTEEQCEEDFELNCPHLSYLVDEFIQLVNSGRLEKTTSVYSAINGRGWNRNVVRTIDDRLVCTNVLNDYLNQIYLPTYKNKTTRNSFSSNCDPKLHFMKLEFQYQLAMSQMGMEFYRKKYMGLLEKLDEIAPGTYIDVDYSIEGGNAHKTLTLNSEQSGNPKSTNP